MSSALRHARPLARILMAVFASILVVTVQLALTARVAAAQAPLSAQNEGAAWSVSTVDGEQGNGRPNFSYGTSAGRSIDDAMQVTNTGSQDLHLKIYAADAFTTAEGGIDILASGEESTDAGAWVTPKTKEIDLKPGESTEVEFTVAVPNNATPGDHSAAIVASLLPSGEGQVQVERRLGLRISVRVIGELKAAVEISDVDSEYIASPNPFAPAKIRTTYTVANTGNTRIRLDDAISVHGLFAFGAPRGATAVEDLLPGSSVRLTREVPTLAIGGASVEVSATALPYDGSLAVPEPFTAESQVAGAPWSLLALIVVVLAAAATVVFVLIRRRREQLYLAYRARERELQSESQKEGALE
ncbi:DUF916 domain-containing protein [Gulosibacter sp. GYB002]|uniref:WxL protein peptidoglycan domain-containing protein n=1 Tax=Gulosibacter sp. GYB002 TaxID=2994391 RepID=UPI002F969975